MGALPRSARSAVQAMPWDNTASQIVELESAQNGLVIVLDPDPSPFRNLTSALQHANLRQIRTMGTEHCLDLIRHTKPDLILYFSDALTPPSQEFEARVSLARTTESLPALRIHALGAGPTQPLRLSKDSNIPEIFIIIRALLRRERLSALKGQRRIGTFVLGEPDFKLFHADRFADPSKTDLCLLGPFFDLRNAVFDRTTRQNLAFDATAWKAGSRTINALVSVTRRKIREHVGRDPIRSVRGIGYALSET